MFWYWHSIDPVMHGQAKVECGILRKGKLCLKCKRSKFKTQGNVEEIQGCRMTLDSHVTMKLKQVLPLSFPDSTLRGSALRTVTGNTCELQLPFYMNCLRFLFFLLCCNCSATLNFFQSWVLITHNLHRPLSTSTYPSWSLIPTCL